MGSPEKNNYSKNTPPSFKHTHWLASFHHACEGIFFAWKNERNLRIDSIITIVVLLICWWLGLSRNEWLVIIACIGAVFTAELLNSLVEAVVDLVVGNRYNLQAKHIKDMAAGMVVVVCIIVLIISTAIVWPHLIEIIGG